MPAVKDLVQPQTIDPVIQLNDFQPERILNSYVITEEIARILVADGEGFLGRILKPAASGMNSFMLLANYGSGKSHMLAFIDSLLNHPDKWDLQKHPALEEVKALQQHRFLTVKVKLSEVRTPLDRLITRAVRDALAKHGIPNPFADWWKTTQRVQSDYRDNSDFEVYLQQAGLSLTMWDRRYREEDEHLFEFADGFLKSRNMETTLQVSAEEMVERTLKAISSHADFGPEATFVLLMDELSDFIQSKSGPEQHADLGYLRDLGEASFKSRFRLMAAVQEDLLNPSNPQFSGVREIIQKMTQRFHRRQMTSQYLHAVVRERVLTKNALQKEQIRKIHLQIRKNLPEYTEPEDTFVDLYPVHSDVIDIFQHLVGSGYLANRSILSYLSEAVSKEDFLQGDAQTTFLTPDQLFAGLALEFKSHPQLQRLAQAYQQATEKAKLLNMGKQLEVVQRFLAALVMYQAANVTKTVEEIINGLQFSAITGSKMAYDLPDAHLKKLQANTGLLKIVSGTGGKRVYQFVTDQSNDQTAKMQQIKSLIGDADVRMGDVVRSFLRLELGLAEGDDLINRKTSFLRDINWSGYNLPREGVALLIDQVNQLAPVAGATDFSFLIWDVASNEAPDLSDLPENVGVWLPAHLTDDERDSIREVAAYRQLEKDLKDSNPNAAAGIKMMGLDAENRVNQAIQRVYLKEGRLVRAGVNLLVDDLKPGMPRTRLGHLIDRLFTAHWQAVYAQAPKLGQLQWTTQHINQLMREFLTEEEGLSSPKPNLRNVLDAVALPLIAELAGDTYRIDRNKPYLVALENAVKQADPKMGMLYADALKLLNQAPYGLPNELAQLVIATSVACQNLMLYGRINSAYGFADLGKIEWKNVNYLKPTGLCKNPVRAAQLLRALGMPEEHMGTIHQQNRIWGNFAEHLKGVLQDRSVRELDQLPIHIAPLKQQVQEAMQGLLPAQRIAQEHQNNAKEGLDTLLDAYPEIPKTGIAALEAEIRALAPLGASLRENKKYLEAELPALLHEERQNLLDRLGKVSELQEVKQWLVDFEQHREEYMGHYLDLHDSHKGDALNWQALENLSWPVLDAASRLQRVRPNPDAQALQRSRQGALSERCTRLRVEELRNHPICIHCHYRGEEGQDPEQLALDLQASAKQGEHFLLEQLLQQKTVIERNLLNTQVSAATRSFLEQLWMHPSLQGLTSQVATELDGLLDNEMRYEDFSLATFSNRLQGKLAGRTLSWSELTVALEQVLQEMRPDGKPSKIHMHIKD